MAVCVEEVSDCGAVLGKMLICCHFTKAGLLTGNQVAFAEKH
jgi:hypothetical protein